MDSEFSNYENGPANAEMARRAQPHPLIFCHNCSCVSLEVISTTPTTATLRCTREHCKTTVTHELTCNYYTSTGPCTCPASGPKCIHCGFSRFMHRPEAIAHHSECTLENFQAKP